ncbi:MAG: aminotransferase class I/II-fold pyridoxal phosphate-dependent enzyme, partial [Gammaproteobacteria bacterium]|nr:aminotransferase class I/II-fold pyridoxal phosphate-dependent enzyme [Gammaproteobacteria bacterium]
PYIYTRWGNPTVKMLEEKLAALEGAEDCVAFGSGMAATTAVLMAGLKAGDHLVMSDVNYAGTAELARSTLPDYGIETTPVDTSDLGAVKAAMRPETRMLWIETPANPIMRLTDIAAVAAIAAAHEVPLAVDSTFATPIATQPLALGADFVVHSLTKYIGGHGDALGGAVLGSRERIEPLRTRPLVHFGGALSPFNAWLIARGAATLPIRMRAHEEGAMKVAAFLEDHPAVGRVNYPGLPSHPQRALAERQMANCSGTLSFQVRGDGAALARRMAKQLEIIHYAVSLGHHRSLIYWIDTDAMMESTFHLEGEPLAGYRAFAGDGLFRLSVGLEDADDLCPDLDRVLS